MEMGFRAERHDGRFPEGILVIDDRHLFMSFGWILPEAQDHKAAVARLIPGWNRFWVATHRSEGVYEPTCGSVRPAVQEVQP